MKRLAAAAVLVGIAVMPVFATMTMKSRIGTFAFAGGRMAFVANGLTVLDPMDGRVVLREPETRAASLTETSDGILVGTPLAFRRAMRYRLFSSAADPAWDVSCDLWHPAERYLICVSEWSILTRRVTLLARSRVDGTIRWSFNTRGGGGEALDAKGRLMIANEDYD